MSDHLPDVDWLIILLGIFKPDDEIFESNYKYIRAKNPAIEAQLENADGFWTALAPATEKEIRRSNRIRLPQEMRFDLQMKRIQQKK